MSGADASGKREFFAPIGVFDSGLGGLSVAREMRRLMPDEDIVYIGDTAHVPYGSRPAAEVRAFSRAITHLLIERERCRVIVVACNTAVSAGVHALREAFPVPVVAIEPGIKPAVALTRTGRVGVLATMGTAGGERLQSLIERFGGNVEVLTQSCPGLVECVERGELDSPATYALTEKYVRPLTERGADVLVLGCTHYPFLRPVIERIAGSGVLILDTGEAVARQAARVASPLPAQQRKNTAGGIKCLVTGEVAASLAGFRACFAFYGTEAPPLRRLIWHGEELQDNGAN